MGRGDAHSGRRRYARQSVRELTFQSPLVATGAAGGSHLGRPRDGAHGRPFSAPSPSTPWGAGGGGDAMRDAQADVPSARRLRAQLAFKNSMVHGILQFTPSIAFCCVLHRCESLDIRCRESFLLQLRRRRSPRGIRGRGGRSVSSGPWRFSRRGVRLGPRRPGAPRRFG